MCIPLGLYQIMDAMESIQQSFFKVGKIPGGGGGYSTQTGIQCSAQLKIWTLRDLKISEKGGLKDLKRVFDKF